MLGELRSIGSHGFADGSRFCDPEPHGQRLEVVSTGTKIVRTKTWDNLGYKWNIHGDLMGYKIGTHFSGFFSGGYQW